MNRAAYRLAASTVFLCLVASPALAQKSGGILRLSHFDSPASMSILEEATRAALQPAMGVFNNLVMYKQDVAQTSLQSVIPDLATSCESTRVNPGIATSKRSRQTAITRSRSALNGRRFGS